MSQPPQANCGKCGLCLVSCPVYRILRQEEASPRARLQLIRAFEKGDLTASPLLKDLVSRCLMCGACATVCPSGINHYSKFMEMRRKMTEALPDPPAIRSLIFLLSREYRLRMAAGLARLGRRLTPGFLTEKYRLGTIPLNRFPAMNPVPVRTSLPEQIPPAGPPRGRVVYFTGCATQYLFGDTGHAAVTLLTRLGYEVIIPRSQTCCGIPMMFHGARDQAATNMITNLTALSDWVRDPDCRAVIVDCTTCGAALTHEYPALAADLRATQALPDTLPPDILDLIAGKTRDLLSFIRDHAHDLPLAPDAEAHPVTYHVPCHSRNRFALTPVVQDLMQRLPCFDFIPVPDMAECCGGGGTFFYEYPDIARRMMAGKLTSARATRARYWLTDCPVCRITLHGSLSDADTLTVTHPAVLIARALETP